MKKILITLSLLLACLAKEHAQSQNGLVREMNSGKKPLGNVQIICLNASPTSSDQSGAFRIQFKDKKPGDLIVFTEIRKMGYEVVNEKQLEIVKIGNSPTLDIPIIMAPEGTVAQAKAKYYQTSDQALKTRYQQEKNKLLEALQKSQINNEAYQAQNKILRDQFDQQKKELDALAEQFARINFDDVDTLYKEALQLFQQGKIEEVIQKLETANLLGELKEVKQREEQVIQLLLLQAETYQITLQSEKVRAFFKDLLAIDSSNVEILQAAAGFYIKQNQLQRGLVLYQHLLQLSTHNELKARTYIRLGNVYHSLQRWEDAVEAFQNARNLFQVLEQNTAGAFQLEIALSLNNLGNVYWNNKQWDKAQEALKESLQILRKLNSTRQGQYLPHIALSLNNIGRFHFEKFQSNPKDYLELFESKKVYTESLDIYQQLADEKPKAVLPNDLRVFFDLKVAFGDNIKDNYDMLIAYLELLNKALAIHQKLAKHNPRDFAPFVALTLINRSNLYRIKKDYSAAMSDLDTALLISKQLRSQDAYTYSPYEAEVLYKIGTLKVQLHQNAAADSSLQAALELYTDLEAESPHSFETKLAIIHLDWAEFSINTNKVTDAFAHCKQAYTFLLSQYNNLNAHFVAKDWLKLRKQIQATIYRTLDPEPKQQAQQFLQQIDSVTTKIYPPKLQEALLKQDFEAAKILSKNWIEINPGFLPARTMEAHVFLFSDGFSNAQYRYKNFKNVTDRQGRSALSLCLEQLLEMEKQGLKHSDTEKAVAYLKKLL